MGFEPTVRKTHNGFRDRPIQPLWHLSKEEITYWIFSKITTRLSKFFGFFDRFLYSRKMFSISSYHESLLDWYDTYRRQLPWRAEAGEVSHPYAVWVSEIMLQQTTVPTVKDYYERFLKKWPTIHGLAEASLDEVLHLWQGLGYYSRARNLHACAKIVTQEHAGVFPADKKSLLLLPGIGPYTAAAILSIAFDAPATVVDGNVERIMARVFRLHTPLPMVKKEIYGHATQLTPIARAGDYAQALMDLGSLICTPKSPKCSLCPLLSYCASAGRDPEEFPKRLPKEAKPVRYGTFFWIENARGEVLLEKRPDKGLLPNLMGFPTSEWKTIQDPSPLTSADLPHVIRHTFTHFHLVGQVVRVKEEGVLPPGIWVHPTQLHNYALPTLMKKVSQLVLREARQ